MLKILVFLLLVAAVLLFFALRRTPPRPPRDWRRGGEDGGPVLPASQIGLDGSRKTKSGTPSGDSRETESVSSDAGGGDGGGD